MRWLKKILRIIAILLPCYVFVLFPVDSFATSYNINAFSAHGLTYDGFYLGLQPQIDVIPGVVSRPNFEPRYFANLTYNFNSSTSKCDFSSYNRGVNIGTSSIVFGGSFTLEPLSPNTTNCNVYNGAFGVSMPNDTPIPSTNPNYIPISAILPANAHFNILPFTGFRTRDGIVYTGNLSLMSLLNNLFGSANDSSDVDNNNSNDRVWVSTATDVSSFSMPLSFESRLDLDSTLNSVVINGSITFLPSQLQIDNYGSIGYLTPDFLSHGVIRIRSRYVFYDESIPALRSHEELDSCDWSYSNSLARLNYSCSVPLTYSAHSDGYFPHLEFSFDDFSPGDERHIFNSEDVVFNDILLITNGVTSEVIEGSRKDLGSTPTVAPGMPDIEDSYGNWSDSFINAIDFTFSNPFTPLFNMFLPPNECANIPIIASMIHSNQTRICPIYPQSVYPITTPVFTFIGVMLLFGFLVRWLNGDSFVYMKGLN